ncbi:3-methyl-2-oxobutanoate hydroxymethyltransferase [Acaryochloris thomasi RCC1774]|uniref:3-methyl-2-oxobutanoate hydroxymethyltransferase n=1 Tax=Acaryochloris thomasi RCC1774 TaxID=1764569 RepID=A0A2W1JRB0_9CYAN|nr:3-methyl-2-oxobutanoate hydroxymethyltransferase [Acaryochloris thomasi]PZD73855.1 3-methyl-2-oxobutanoate hydroxymethyltransferase [Acaryochloris thomasi RCC1774]
MKKDAAYLRQKKQNGQKIVSLTCYDYPTAVLEEQAGVDLIIVGDSVGTNVLGYASEQEVTLADIAHHLRAVCRGASEPYILADLPFGTYETPQQALKNAEYLLAQGADIVKLEGMPVEVVQHLIAHDIPLCGHLGLLPQTHIKKAVQGKRFDQAKALVEDALRLEQLGILMLVLELIPEELGQIVTEKLKIPTIGIGAGRHTDGQVLIVNDILGITPRKFRLAKKYQDYQGLTLQTLQKYGHDVEQVIFPEESNVSHMAAEELQQLRDWLA